MTGSMLAVTLAGAWLTVGLGVAGLLVGRGESPGTAVAAVVAWPTLVSLLSGPVTPAAPPGPYSGRIAAAFLALRQALGDPALGSGTELSSLDAIEASLRRADQRLAAVDRLLVDPGVAEDPASQRLIVARAHAAEEVETVLRQLVTVRVQLGLVALAGDTSTVRAHLAELAARARALEEVTC